MREGFSRFLEGEEARFVGGLGGYLVGDFFDLVFRLGEGVADGWDDGFRGEGGQDRIWKSGARKGCMKF